MPSPSSSTGAHAEAPRAKFKKKRCGFRLCQKTYQPVRGEQRFCSTRCRVRQWHDDRALKLATKLMRDVLDKMRGEV